MSRLPVLCLFLAGCTLWASQPASVPAEYQDLYTTLTTQISSFDSTVRASWDGSLSQVNYAPQLEAGIAARYMGLIGPNYYQGAAMPQLEELQALGAQAIKLQVSFPILYQPFYSANPSLYQSFANFYQQLASDIHSRGLKLVVECTPENAFPGVNVTDFINYYQSLSWNDYVTGRAQEALTIVQLMHPDYLSVVTEPDSEYDYTGQANAQTVAGSTQIVQAVLNTLANAGVTNVSVGAGVGTWLASGSDYIQSFASLPLQYIDIHVYPINGNYLTNAIAIANQAHSLNKQVAMSGLWDFKLRDDEVGVLTLTQASARDPFSFWAPVDTAFLQSISDFANYEHAEFITPFWTHYFFGYLNYSTYASVPIGPLITMGNSAAMNAELQGQASSTGMAWLALCVPTPDTTPPEAPDLPTTDGVSSTSDVIDWTTAADNVGVAAYNLYRNGSLVTTTSRLTYSDEGLSPGTSYTYTLTAVDASGNESQPSLPLVVQTTNAPSPSVPTALTATAASISEADLSWGASSSSIGVKGYLVYMGSSPTDLNPYRTTSTNSFADTSVGPSLTFYYAVLAFDRAGNQSSLTPVVSVTLPQEPPPSTPGQPVAQTVSYNQVVLSWPASASSIGIGGYFVYRGSSPSTMTLLTHTFVNTVIDNQVSPAGAYYYAVTAFDSNGLNSAQSPAAAVSTPSEPAPTVPTAVSAQALAYNQVAISWSASSSVAGVSGYIVYRGTSPSSLSTYGNSKTVGFTDNQAQPSTTYYFAVAAYDMYGLHSAQTTPVSVVTPQEPAPTAPTALTAQAAAYNQVNLSWSASTSAFRIPGYAIYRGTSPASLSVIGSSPAPSYTDSQTQPSTTYYYAVAAYDVYGVYSPQSAVASAATPREPSPSVPSQVKAQPAAYNQVSLSWTASSGSLSVSGYEIYRGTSPASLSALGVSKATGYTDSQAQPATTYYYSVAAYDIYGVSSAQSAPVSAVTPREPPPSAPGGVSAHAVAYNQTNLSWSASTGAYRIPGYVVYRGTSPSSLAAFGSSKTTTFTDSHTAPSTTYYYAIEAYDLYGVDSAESAVVSATTPKEAAPSTPAQVAGQAPAYNQVNLTWSASSGPFRIPGYTIYRGTSPGSLSAIGSSSTPSYTDTHTAPSTAYYYAVAAYDVYGLYSPQSQTLSVGTPKEPPPSTPSQVAAQAPAYNQVNLSWSPSSSGLQIAGYVVYRGTSYPALNSVGVSKTASFTDTATAPSRTYYYAVAAYDIYGVLSAQSGQTSITTPQKPAP